VLPEVPGRLLQTTAYISLLSDRINIVELPSAVDLRVIENVWFIH
jgi:hypothetical protein